MASIPPRTLGVIPAFDKLPAQEFAPELSSWLADKGCRTINEAELLSGRRADALVVLGGDGMMMHVAHAHPGIPLLGINFGTVGFLAMVERSRWKPGLEALLTGSYEIQTGPTLTAEMVRNGQVIESGWAINDVVIRSGIRMVEVELYVDRQYVNTYPGDGMIVASPQGSTAYCMAAGGPILTAGVHGFAVTPLSPHSPIRATLVLPEESLIELVVSNEREAHLILDGGELRDLRHGDIVRVRKGTEQFRLIVVPGMSFYDAFRSKFNYLIRPNARPSLGYRR
jgi:NAD+ kinase